MSAGPLAPRGRRHDLGLGGVGRPVGGGTGHALGGEHRRARGRIDLGIVVQLDDLGRLEVGRGDLGEAHHEHRPDGEVRRDDAVALGERLLERGVVGLGEAGRARHGVDALAGQPEQVRSCRFEMGEVDGHVDPGVEEGVRALGDLPGAVDPRDLTQVEPGVVRIDCGNQLQSRIGVDRGADGAPHAPPGPEHAHPQRHGENLGGQGDRCHRGGGPTLSAARPGGDRRRRRRGRRSTRPGGRRAPVAAPGRRRRG